MLLVNYKYNDYVYFGSIYGTQHHGQPSQVLHQYKNIHYIHLHATYIFVLLLHAYMRLWDYWPEDYKCHSMLFIHYTWSCTATDFSKCTYIMHSVCLVQLVARLTASTHNMPTLYHSILTFSQQYGFWPSIWVIWLLVLGHVFWPSVWGHVFWPSVLGHVFWPWYEAMVFVPC